MKDYDEIEDRSIWRLFNAHIGNNLRKDQSYLYS